MQAVGDPGLTRRLHGLSLFGEVADHIHWGLMELRERVARHVAAFAARSITGVTTRGGTIGLTTTGVTTHSRSWPRRFCAGSGPVFAQARGNPLPRLRTRGRMASMTSSSDHVERNRRHWDESAAGCSGPLARGHWSKTEPTWGLWASPEAEVGVFGGGVAGLDVVELGCGTGYVSAWLARAGRGRSASTSLASNWLRRGR